MRHLKDLPDGAQKKAYEYLRRAPAGIQTPLRTAFMELDAGTETLEST